MTCTKKLVPTFGNYTWDLKEKRLFSGFSSDRETRITNNGYFILKKDGKRYKKTANQLDLLCGILGYEKMIEADKRQANRKKRSKA